MSGLHVRCRELAGNEACRIFHLGRLMQGQNGNYKTLPTWFRHNPWFRFRGSSLFEFLSSAKKYAGYSNTNEKDARPSLARYALPEKEFPTQCARHVVQSCNRYHDGRASFSFVLE